MRVGGSANGKGWSFPMNPPLLYFYRGVPSEFGVPRAKNVIRLGALCQGAWLYLAPEYYENLIKSMPDRIKAS